MSDNSYEEMRGDRSEIERREEASLRAAAERGLRIVYPARGEVQLDLDSPAALDVYRQQRQILSEVLVFEDERIVPSRTPGHWHVTVRVANDLSESSRIALQALLGSDLKREAINYIRLRVGMSRPCCLFELPEALPPAAEPETSEDCEDALF